MKQTVLNLMRAVSLLLNFHSFFFFIPISIPTKDTLSPESYVNSGNFLKKWLGHSYPLGLWCRYSWW